MAAQKNKVILIFHVPVDKMREFSANVVNPRVDQFLETQVTKKLEETHGNLDHVLSQLGWKK